MKILKVFVKFVEEPYNPELTLNRSILLALVLLISCKDESFNTTNSFTHNGKRFLLAKGYIIDQGTDIDNTWRAYDVYLVSKGVTISMNAFGGLDLEGTGHALKFSFASASLTELKSANYRWATTTPQSTLQSAAMFNPFGESHASFCCAATSGKGSVTVIKTDLEHSFEFGLDVDGGALQGNFKGELEALN